MSALQTLVSLGGRQEFRAGDWVEVRSKAEILSTLDKSGRLDGMRFMPNMFACCGQRFRVGQSAHKTCDTINWTGGRRLSDSVHLEGSRCNGQGYDGCAADCLIFWKTAWLTRVSGPQTTAASGESAASSAAPAQASGCTEQDVIAGTRAPGPDDGKGPTYACQATELFDATTPLAWWDLRQYVEDYRSGNVGVRRLANGLAYASFNHLVGLAKKTHTGADRVLMAAYDRFQSLVGGLPFPRRSGVVPPGQKTPAVTLDLQPGELVRVKPYHEILATLDADNKNRGLYFDAEHVPYCGGTFRVRSRVAKIVNENTGKMMDFKSGSIILEGAACQSRYSNCRMFCPRAIYPYWREIWLERVEASAAEAPQAPKPAASLSA